MSIFARRTPAGHSVESEVVRVPIASIRASEVIVLRDGYLSIQRRWRTCKVAICVLSDG